MVGLSRRWTGGPVDRWTGLTTATLLGVRSQRRRRKARLRVATPQRRPQKLAVDAGPPAPDSFRVAFQTTRGNFVVQVNRAWAPLGADRFYQLVGQQFFDGEKFFRVVPGFVAQFGLNGDPKRNEAWDTHLLDDSVRHTNAKGHAHVRRDGRAELAQPPVVLQPEGQPAASTASGFAPIGVVVEGQSVVDSLYSGYGETPDQTSVQNLGNSYLDRAFPKLDGIKSARIVTTK